MVTTVRVRTSYIEGDITNNGTVDLYLDANDNVALVAQGNTNSVISGTGSWDLYTVLMSKITSRSNYLEVQSSAFRNRDARTLRSTMVLMFTTTAVRTPSAPAPITRSRQTSRLTVVAAP